MPIVRIEMAEGRSQNEKEKLLTAVTAAIHESIGAPLPTIHIMLKEVSSDHIMIGGELLSEKPLREKV